MNTSKWLCFSCCFFLALVSSGVAQDFGGTFDAVKATINIDGDLSDWDSIGGDLRPHDSTRFNEGEAVLAVNIKWAWDDTYLYTLVEETLNEEGKLDDDPDHGIDPETDEPFDRFAWTSDVEVDTNPNAAAWRSDSVGFFDAPGELCCGTTVDDQTGPLTQRWVGLSPFTDVDHVLFDVRTRPEDGSTNMLVGDDAGEEEPGGPADEIGKARNVDPNLNDGARAVEFRMRWDQLRWPEDHERAIEGHTLADVGVGYVFRDDPLLVEGDGFTREEQSFPGTTRSPGAVPEEDVTFVRLIGDPRDLDGDGVITVNDIDLVGIGDTALRDAIIVGAGTELGDSDGNGEFDSDDLLQVFSAGHYANGEAAVYTEGDWDIDGDFDSDDLLEAFAAGGYDNGPPGAAAVPEPGSALLLLLAGLGLLGWRRR